VASRGCLATSRLYCYLLSLKVQHIVYRVFWLHRIYYIMLFIPDKWHLTAGFTIGKVVIRHKLIVITHNHAYLQMLHYFLCDVVIFRS